ncbi:hypothetical protein I3843_09G025700 [Carya illinoinensis]|nr:hypothetical protein I3843_09G025700 [Carya illinoinensis]
MVLAFFFFLHLIIFHFLRFLLENPCCNRVLLPGEYSATKTQVRPDPNDADFYGSDWRPHDLDSGWVGPKPDCG